MAEKRWGAASSFLKGAYSSGIGADRIYNALRGTDMALTRREVREAYHTLMAEGVNQEAIGRLRGNVSVPEFYISDGPASMKDNYRYNLAITIDVTRKDAQGNKYVTTETVWRAVGSGERVSKDQIVQDYIDENYDNLAESDVYIRNALVENVYRRGTE